jgi:prepilin-type N-terminal cleavage/methylation domain-containing protein
MKSPSAFHSKGFTLIETLIAIGVIAVLLTGFMMVFAPAAAGIRKALSIQELDRMTSTLEQEIVTVRGNSGTGTAQTGFVQALEWIRDSQTVGQALLLYQYRGKLSDTRADGTAKPEPTAKGKLPGKDYVVVPMMRRNSDPLFLEDLTAVVGSVYVVKCTQLVYSAGELKPGKAGVITDMKGQGAATIDDYPDAVVAFTADFYGLPTRKVSYFNSGGGFTKQFAIVKKPVLTRNLAARR